MHRVLVLGAGKIGALIAGLFGESGDYDVRLADVDGQAAATVVDAHGLKGLQAIELDATDEDALRKQLRQHPVDAVVSSLPYFCNVAVGKAARELELHYFDLTEDVAVTAEIRALAEGASRAFAPQCGLAPGFISIAANELITHFDEIDSVKLRVGALPQNPNNVLKYSLTWSTDGLINEYGNPCQCLRGGKVISVEPLEGLEGIEIDGRRYEAFNTSGGLGSLGDTYADQVRTMDYKTIRYPGHCKQMRLLMNDLRLNDDRATLKRVLEHAVPRTLQDVVIVYVAVRGVQDNEYREENYVNSIYPQVIAGRLWSAIQVTTAAGVCGVVDLVLGNPGDYTGFVTQERFRLKDFIENRFGKFYAHGGTSEISSRLIATGRTGSQRKTAAART
ncbi:MAG: saccharopine dehydrogenase NADP-binding domain-containing protein [Gammaproteobacteria bacterium]|nr:saccharopine dehydrogenase NADP-binding domain-containing protein [Gammaproteobacteria bacterium]